MKKFFKKFFSTSLKAATANAVMNRDHKRYFVNNLLDYQEGQTAPIPEHSVEQAVFKIIENINSHFEANEHNSKDGIYLGTGGVAYMYYHLSKNPKLKKHRENFLFKTEEYLRPALNYAGKIAKRTKDECSFILGNSGIYAVAAVFFKNTGREELYEKYRNLYYDAGEICKTPNFLRCGSDELFVGRAGYVLGSVWLSKETGAPLNTPMLHELCHTIVNSGREYSQKVKSPSPLMYAYYDVEYLGAAHGLCSILQVLMSVPGFLEKNPNEEKDIRGSVDFILKLQDSQGNFPCAMDEAGSPRHDLVHWCHGAGGVIYMMAKAYLVWKDEKYLRSCEKAADTIWTKGLLKKGPGICHGVAGNGYSFLLLYRLTGEQKHLARALAFAKFMESDKFKREANTPDNPYSLYEGVAGTACYLGDLLEPQQAAFPFSDVYM